MSARGARLNAFGPVLLFLPDDHLLAQALAQANDVRAVKHMDSDGFILL